MPRTADHDARRRQVADAVEKLVADEGLDAVTVARTAAAAGISVGLVQRYFPAKDDMLLHTFTAVRQRIEQRVMAGVRDAVDARVEDILRTALAELLPLDAVRRRECRVVLAFTGRAIGNDHLTGALRAGNAHLRALLAQAIHNGKECGEVPAETDAPAAAAQLLATVDGLALHTYTDPGVVHATAVLAEHLRRVFPGHCRQPGVTSAAPAVLP